jgi:hypothetical protein
VAEQPVRGAAVEEREAPTRLAVQLERPPLRLVQPECDLGFGSRRSVANHPESQYDDGAPDRGSLRLGRLVGEGDRLEVDRRTDRFEPGG